MRATRVEKDALGTLTLPAEALYGIHTARAMDNVAVSGRPPAAALVSAYGMVKHAALEANHALGRPGDEVYGALREACEELTAGALGEHIRVDALQGGAGTSLNMNVNEVLANRALQILGHAPGDYARIDPLADVNRHQSTNDTFPTALRAAAILKLRDLEKALVVLQEAFQVKEHEMAGVVRVARTQLGERDQTPSTISRSRSEAPRAWASAAW